ncbi:MAG: GNAT family N-acetyltransferase, partial [Oscillochloris sp.]|nr:GNAT family N-acetyltransferase [Oscillochloris sp.]
MNDQALSDGLVLRTLHADEDVARVAAFHSSVFGPGLATLVQGLLQHHPQRAQSHWLYVEDTTTNKVVGGLCLLPWKLDFAGVELHAGEMGIVATDENYRKRGLIRALNERFDTLLHADNYDLSIIQGIPYFYRQFDYHYTMPLEAWCRVELHQFSGDTPEGYEFRRANETDIPQLAELYAAAASDLTISARRDEAIWRYLLGPAMQTETAGAFWLISTPNRNPAGYVRVMESGFGDGLICGEASQLGADTAVASLHWLTNLARERHKPYLRLNVPKRHVINQVAQVRGAGEWSAYAWQVRILDPVALLHKLGPLFEQRIAASPSPHSPATLIINLLP